ncbi:MBL fold metallo-hydrolase [Lapillicoccus sp.]|uniref:MBL fold metallo-hydrolase n=1 Tax=Lapillicoccus sp. TaxID=1909287 RepID=UPI0025D0AEF1|nr:MBL fold metallo-hydrolase [Lapillicoccus sp.]
MLMIAFPAAVFATNCYVVAPGPGEECVIVDPGIGVEAQLAEVLAEHRLRPAAVLLTHGHVDHVYSVTPVCGGDTAAYIHEDDRYRLVDPVAGLDRGLVAMMEQEFGTRATWREPERVVTITDHETLTLAGLELSVLHAPGHTEGSVMFTLPQAPDDMPGAPAVAVTATCLSGDVLFAGSIGRSDLAGGDPRAMERSLRDVVLPLPDDMLVLPGHGPSTTIGRERTGNPYLQGLGA